MKSLKLTDETAKEARRTGRTRSGGSVEGALREYLKTPGGGWNETEQAWDALIDAISAAVRWLPGTPEQPTTVSERLTRFGDAARDMVHCALDAGWDAHVTRAETDQ